MPTRQPAPLRAAVAAIAFAFVLALVGCTDGGRPSGATTHYTAGGRHACASGASIELDGSSRSFFIEGRCGTVYVRGDGNTVHLQRAVSLNVQGQSDSVTVDDGVGSALVKGNGVSVTADSIGSVQLTGQRNSITAPALGSVTVQGDRNAVTTHLKPSDYRVSGQNDTLTLQ
jgi:hypothetical protein